MASDVFISYAQGDESRAAELAAALESKGWSVWWDRHIPPGRTFDEVIEQALTQARCVVVLWSTESVRSRWVRAEASAAADRGTLVPAIIEPVTIPLEFRRVQAADLTNWHGDLSDAEFQHLVETLAHLIHAGARPHTPPTLKGGTPVRALLERRVPAWLPLVASFIAGAGLVYLVLGGDGARPRESDAPTSDSISVEREVPTSPGSAGTAGTAPRTPDAPTKGRINLLSSANGGHLMAAPSDSWQHPIDDDTKNWQYIQSGGGDGVYAFKNEQAATFDVFMMLIDETTDLNIKEFELFVGNESPLGTFQSIGKYQTQNIRLYPSPWQEFKFAPVRARYFKVHVISAWGRSWSNNPKVVEWQLLGNF
jgi:hypothetical protein